MIHSLLYNLCSSLISISKNNQSRLPPEVNRILYVRNLPFKITAEELYDIFGKYGAVYQIRLGERGKDTRGTAFVGEWLVWLLCYYIHEFFVLFLNNLLYLQYTCIQYVAHTIKQSTYTIESIRRHI